MPARPVVAMHAMLMAWSTWCTGKLWLRLSCKYKRLHTVHVETLPMYRWDSIKPASRKRCSWKFPTACLMGCPCLEAG